MKRLGPSHELIADNTPLLVRLQFALFKRDLPAEFFKPLCHRLGRRFRISVMDGHFIKPAVEEVPLHCGGGGTRQQALLGLNLQHSQSGLISGSENRKVQRMFGRPGYQLLRRVSPAQAEGRLKQRLAGELCAGDAQQDKRPERGELPDSKRRFSHAPSIHRGRLCGKPRTQRGGFALVEATMALSLLAVIGLMLLKLSLNVIQPRQYTLQQILSDSYLTFERSRIERIPFEELVSANSSWPANPRVATEVVEIGKLPGGLPVFGTVTRTRFPDGNNYPEDGGQGTPDTNPAAMKIWKVQSVLSYQIANRTYVKSRTQVRAQ